jgi:hypothetical protein
MTTPNKGEVMLVALINTDGTVEAKQIDGSLQSMQSIVEGLIQPVDLQEDMTLWVNEEGMYREDYNALASGIAGIHLNGPAFITGGVNEEGETMGLNPAYIPNIKNYAEIMFSMG